MSNPWQFYAFQHKEHLPRLLGECLDEAEMRVPDVDAIAVTTRPGLVIALKEGIKLGLDLSRLVDNITTFQPWRPNHL